MATILKVWHHIRNPTPSVTVSQSDLKQRSIRLFLEQRRPNKKNNNKMSSNIGTMDQFLIQKRLHTRNCQMYKYYTITCTRMDPMSSLNIVSLLTTKSNCIKIAKSARKGHCIRQCYKLNASTVSFDMCLATGIILPVYVQYYQCEHAA